MFCDSPRVFISILRIFFNNSFESISVYNDPDGIGYNLGNLDFVKNLGDDFIGADVVRFSLVGHADAVA